MSSHTATGRLITAAVFLVAGIAVLILLSTVAGIIMIVAALVIAGLGLAGYRGLLDLGRGKRMDEEDRL